MRKILIEIKVVPFQKIAFLRVFLPICFQIKAHTSAIFKPSEYICFSLFVVHNAQREFRHANMSSHPAQFL